VSKAAARFVVVAPAPRARFCVREHVVLLVFVLVLLLLLQPQLLQQLQLLLLHGRLESQARMRVAATHSMGGGRNGW